MVWLCKQYRLDLYFYQTTIITISNIILNRFIKLVTLVTHLTWGIYMRHVTWYTKNTKILSKNNSAQPSYFFLSLILFYFRPSNADALQFIIPILKKIIWPIITKVNRTLLWSWTKSIKIQNWSRISIYKIYWTVLLVT